MKFLIVCIVSSMLFVGLSFAGKSFFGMQMDHGMDMGSVECVNHCIDSSVFPVVPSSALPVLLFVALLIAFVSAFGRREHSEGTHTLQYIRLTEPILLALRSHQCSPVMIRD